MNKQLKTLLTKVILRITETISSPPSRNPHMNLVPEGVRQRVAKAYLACLRQFRGELQRYPWNTNNISKCLSSNPQNTYYLDSLQNRNTRPKRA